MNKGNTLALVAAAPLLYRLHGDTKTGWSIRYGFECGDGWFDLLMRLSVKIEADLRAMLTGGKRREDLPCVYPGQGEIRHAAVPYEPVRTVARLD